MNYDELLTRVKKLSVDVDSLLQLVSGCIPKPCMSVDDLVRRLEDSPGVVDSVLINDVREAGLVIFVVDDGPIVVAHGAMYGYTHIYVENDVVRVYRNGFVRSWSDFFAGAGVRTEAAVRDYLSYRDGAAVLTITGQPGQFGLSCSVRSVPFRFRDSGAGGLVVALVDLPERSGCGVG